MDEETEENTAETLKNLAELASQVSSEATQGNELANDSQEAAQLANQPQEQPVLSSQNGELNSGGPESSLVTSGQANEGDTFDDDVDMAIDDDDQEPGPDLSVKGPDGDSETPVGSAVSARSEPTGNPPESGDDSNYKFQYTQDGYHYYTDTANLWYCQDAAGYWYYQNSEGEFVAWETGTPTEEVVRPTESSSTEAKAAVKRENTTDVKTEQIEVKKAYEEATVTGIKKEASATKESIENVKIDAREGTNNNKAEGLTFGLSIVPIDKEGHPVYPRNSEGKPVLPTGNDGRKVFPLDKDGNPLFPYDKENGKPGFPVGDDGQPVFPIGPHGRPIVPRGVTGKPIFPYGSDGKPIFPLGHDGKPTAPVTVDGKAVLPLDEKGQPVIPFGPDGQPLILVGADGTPLDVHSQAQIQFQKMQWEYYQQQYYLQWQQQWQQQQAMFQQQQQQQNQHQRYPPPQHSAAGGYAPYQGSHAYAGWNPNSSNKKPKNVHPQDIDLPAAPPTRGYEPTKPLGDLKGGYNSNRNRSSTDSTDKQDQASTYPAHNPSDLEETERKKPDARSLILQKQFKQKLAMAREKTGTPQPESKLAPPPPEEAKNSTAAPPSQASADATATESKQPSPKPTLLRSRQPSELQNLAEVFKKEKHVNPIIPSIEKGKGAPEGLRKRSKDRRASSTSSVSDDDRADRRSRRNRFPGKASSSGKARSHRSRRSGSGSRGSESPVVEPRTQKTYQFDGRGRTIYYNQGGSSTSRRYSSSGGGYRGSVGGRGYDASSAGYGRNLGRSTEDALELYESERRNRRRRRSESSERSGSSEDERKKRRRSSGARKQRSLSRSATPESGRKKVSHDEKPKPTGEKGQIVDEALLYGPAAPASDQDSSPGGSPAPQNQNLELGKQKSINDVLEEAERNFQESADEKTVSDTIIKIIGVDDNPMDWNSKTLQTTSTVPLIQYSCKPDKFTSFMLMKKDFEGQGGFKQALRRFQEHQTELTLADQRRAKEEQEQKDRQKEREEIEASERKGDVVDIKWKPITFQEAKPASPAQPVQKPEPQEPPKSLDFEESETLPDEVEIPQTEEELRILREKAMKTIEKSQKVLEVIEQKKALVLKKEKVSKLESSEDSDEKESEKKKKKRKRRMKKKEKRRLKAAAKKAKEKRRKKKKQKEESTEESSSSSEEEKQKKKRKKKRKVIESDSSDSELDVKKKRKKKEKRDKKRKGKKKKKAESEESEEAAEQSAKEENAMEEGELDPTQSDEGVGNKKLETPEGRESMKREESRNKKMEKKRKKKKTKERSDSTESRKKTKNQKGNSDSSTSEDEAATSSSKVKRRKKRRSKHRLQKNGVDEAQHSMKKVSVEPEEMDENGPPRSRSSSGEARKSAERMEAGAGKMDDVSSTESTGLPKTHPIFLPSEDDLLLRKKKFYDRQEKPASKEKSRTKSPSRSRSRSKSSERSIDRRKSTSSERSFGKRRPSPPKVRKFLQKGPSMSPERVNPKFTVAPRKPMDMFDSAGSRRSVSSTRSSAFAESRNMTQQYEQFQEDIHDKPATEGRRTVEIEREELEESRSPEPAQLVLLTEEQKKTLETVKNSGNDKNTRQLYRQLQWKFVGVQEKLLENQQPQPSTMTPGHPRDPRRRPISGPLASSLPGAPLRSQVSPGESLPKRQVSAQSSYGNPTFPAYKTNQPDFHYQGWK